MCAVPTDVAPRDAPMLSVVIPAYNERARLGHTLAAWHAWLGEQAMPAELIVVDDGSRDGTAALVRDFESSDLVALHLLINETNRGKGASIRRGMLQARGAVRLLCDADLNVPPSELPHLTEAMECGAAVAIGSRRVGQAEVHRTWFRRIGTWGFHLLRGWLLLPTIRDTQCGFKAFTAEAAKAIFERQTLEGYGFDLEVLAIARRLGYAIEEVPVRWDVVPGSKVRPIRDGLSLLADVWRVRQKWGRAA
jgi:dolichyl-phosphate beta-glucosyltransferase